MKNSEESVRPPDFPTFKDNEIECGSQDVDLDLVSEIGGIECYTFRVASPDGDRIFRDSEYYDNRTNRSFLARAYKRAHHPQNHIVIMYNGLDETVFATSHPIFSFYDELGLRLATSDILAIMLPTPYHMNRALAYRSVEVGSTLRETLGDRFIRMHIPSEALISKPANIYINHFQGCRETLALCEFFLSNHEDELRRDVKPIQIVSERIANTLHNWVTKRPSVSLLGYSLGGLRALTEFLLNRRRAQKNGRPPLFSGCVPVCSGGSLSDLATPSWIDQMKWKNMIDDLIIGDSAKPLEAALNIFETEREFAHEYFQTLKDIFLGNAQSMRALGPEAAKTGRSMFFLLGGADELIPPDAIRRINPEGGVNILQVSGLGHLFAFDLAWNTTKGLICDVLTQFLANVPSLDRLPDPGELIQQLVLLDISLALLPYRSYIDAKVLQRAAHSIKNTHVDEGLIRRILGIDLEIGLRNDLSVDDERLNHAFQDYIVESLDKLALQVKRRVVNPALFWPEWEKHFLGGILHQDAGLRRRVLDLNGLNRGSRLDTKMIRAHLLTEVRHEELLEEQEKRLEGGRNRLTKAFTTYVKRRSPG